MAPRGKTTTLSIVIAGDAKGAKKAMGETETSAKGLTRSLGGMAATAGAFLAGGAVVRWAKESIDAYRSVGAELLQLQRLTGGSDEFIPGLFVAAQQSGVAIDKLSAALGIFQSKVQKGGLEKFGIDAKNAAGEARSFEAILGDVMDRYAELEGAERVDFARSLFGRGGGDIMKLLGKGREEMEGFVEEAKRLGITLNAADLKKATDNQRDFQLALMAAKVTIGKELLPMVTTFTTTLANNLPAVAGAVGSVASAFNALPGPLKAATGFAIAFGPAVRLAGVALGPLQAGIGYLRGASEGMTNFRLGLMGATQAGAGAANTIGSLLGRIAGSPALMAGAAVGVGLLTIAFIEMADGAKRARENAKSLVETAAATGDSLEQVFNEKLAKTLAGISGGFDIGDSDNLFRKVVDAIGLSADDLAAGLRGTNEEFDAFKESLREDVKDSDYINQIGLFEEDLDALRGSAQKAADQQRILEEANEALGVTTEETAEATEEETVAVTRNTFAQRTLADAIKERKSALDSIISAQRSVESAEEGVTSALEELADAEAAASHDSDEYRASLEAQEDAAAGVQDAIEAVSEAREAEADAIAAIGDAEEGVEDAKRGVAEAERDLNVVRAEAAERIEDLAEAARDAALAEEGAAIDVAKAEKALRDAQRGGASELEIRELRLKLKEAEEALRQAADETPEAAAAAAAAAAAGPEGSPEYLEAQQALADAHQGVADAQAQVREAHEAAADAAERVREASDGVTEAEKRVGEAARDTARLEEESAERIEEAKAGVEAANSDLRDAQIDLTEAVYGTEAAVRAQQTALRNLANTFAPGTPERQHLEWLIAALGFVLSGGVGPGGAYGSPDAVPGNRPSELPSGPDIVDSINPFTNRRGGVTINQFIEGSSVREYRRAGQMIDGVLDKAARGMG